ncbi:MAG: hypothetical protein NC400_05010, partial [Clostridium sp.]|nr:hypothetical protein [Clostridium sp.]
MKISELQCPSCGGKLKVDEKNPSIATCEYCNSQYALEWDKDEAYFNRSINYTVPKAPESGGGGGWGLNGKKGVLLLFAITAFVIIVMCVSHLGKVQRKAQTDSSGLTIDLSGFSKEAGAAGTENRAEDAGEAESGIGKAGNGAEASEDAENGTGDAGEFTSPA